MPELKLKDELHKLESQYEPPLQMQKRLIWICVACGSVLLVGLYLLMFFI